MLCCFQSQVKSWLATDFIMKQFGPIKYSTEVTRARNVIRQSSQTFSQLTGENEFPADTWALAGKTNAPLINGQQSKQKKKIFTFAPCWKTEPVFGPSSRCIISGPACGLRKAPHRESSVRVSLFVPTEITHVLGQGFIYIPVAGICVLFYVRRLRFPCYY